MHRAKIVDLLFYKDGCLRETDELYGPCVAEEDPLFEVCVACGCGFCVMSACRYGCSSGMM
jgi:hypothetical protein